MQMATSEVLAQDANIGKQSSGKRMSKAYTASCQDVIREGQVWLPVSQKDIVQTIHIRQKVMILYTCAVALSPVMCILCCSKAARWRAERPTIWCLQLCRQRLSGFTPRPSHQVLTASSAHKLAQWSATPSVLIARQCACVCDECISREPGSLFLRVPVSAHPCKAQNKPVSDLP